MGGLFSAADPAQTEKQYLCNDEFAMSTWKRSKPESSNSTRDPASRRPITELSAAPKATIKALDLNIDPDAGGDPYNRTGHFLVEELRKYEG